MKIIEKINSQTDIDLQMENEESIRFVIRAALDMYSHFFPECSLSYDVLTGSELNQYLTKEYGYEPTCPPLDLFVVFKVYDHPSCRDGFISASFNVLGEHEAQVFEPWNEFHTFFFKVLHGFKGNFFLVFGDTREIMEEFEDAGVEVSYTWTLNFPLKNEPTLEELSEKLNKYREQPKKTLKIGRNEPCPCGSGKKNKKCCKFDTILV